MTQTLPALVLSLGLSVPADLPPAPASIPAPDPLAKALVAKLSFEGGARERAFFEGLVGKLLEAPSMRALAQETIDADGPVSVRFAAMPGTELYERRDGRLAFTAPEAALVLRGVDSARITLNEACLRIDPEYAALDCTRQLAHELFGHTLPWMRAQKDGLRSVYLLYDDEYRSRLVGWLFTLETTGEVRDPQASCDVEDSTGAVHAMQASYSSSAGGLTRAELADPLAAFRDHLARAKTDRARGSAAPQVASFESGWGAAHVDEFKAAALHPFFKAADDATEALRASLAARADKLFRFGDCSDYH